MPASPDPIPLDAAETIAVAAAAGLAAGAAFALVLVADVRLTGRNVDDLLALGRFVVPDNRRARLVGLGIHLVNSVGLALVYGLARPKLPGPPWARGALFATAENVLLYPLMMLEDKHPAIRDGSLDHYWTWPAFIQSIPRHLIYGAVLGVADHKLRRGKQQTSTILDRTSSAHKTITNGGYVVSAPAPSRSRPPSAPV